MMEDADQLEGTGTRTRNAPGSARFTRRKRLNTSREDKMTKLIFWAWTLLTILTLAVASLFWTYIWSHYGFDWRTVGLMTIAIMLTWAGIKLANKWWII